MPPIPFHVAFVTAGEMPSASALHASQVLQPAAALVAAGHQVTWLAAVPFLSWLRDIVTGGRRVALARESAHAQGLRFEAFVVPVSIGGLVSFLFRSPVMRWGGWRLAHRLNASSPTLLQCRSYYATHMALAACQASDGAPWRVSFDMRSLMADELPLTLGVLGRACHGFAKQWEHWLLRRADAAFLPLRGGCRRLALESGVRVDYAPIQGFDRVAGWSPDFEARWRERAIGYAGSIADWHDAQLLREMLGLVAGSSPRLAMAPDPRLGGLPARAYPHAAMPAFYDSLVALVVPGRTDVGDVFVSMKVRSNFFSTKAAEALSMGVPLIVSSELAELATFVRDHGCGAIYDPSSRRLEYPANAMGDDRTRWEAMTRAAFTAGAVFERRRVLAIYRERWESLFE